MTQTKHTPLPWYLTNDSADRLVYVVDDTLSNPNIVSCDSEANAEFITRACNSHYELLDALEGVVKRLSIYAESQIGKSRSVDLYAAFKDAKAAIAKATGEA